MVVEDIDVNQTLEKARQLLKKEKGLSPASQSVEEILIDRKTIPPGHYRKAGFEARQVFDVKVSLHVKEYRAEILENRQGKRFIADFPEGVIGATQYGPEVKAQSVYLSQFQLIPLARVKDHFDHQVGLALSRGSIANFNREAYTHLAPFESWIKKQLLRSPVNHSDETGIRVDGKTFWLHTLSNDKFTFYHPDSQRGKPATEIQKLRRRHASVHDLKERPLYQ